MFDFIPVSLYSDVFYQFMLCVTVLVFFLLLSRNMNDRALKSSTSGIGFFLVILLISYMGSRLPSYYFGDTGNYAQGYKMLQEGQNVEIKNDYIFNYFMVFCSKIMSVRLFLFIDALIYILPMYFFSRKYCGSYWFFAFLMFCISFSFWPYGVNGIRNGMATSVFIWGLVFYDRKWLMYSLFVLSFGIHNSLIIPIAAFLTASVYKNPKIYLYIWLACIPLSLIGGNFWAGFFTALGLGDSRIESYLDTNAIADLAKSERTTFSSIGFRWDFVLYSASGVFVGWYFLIKNKVKDNFYIHLWGIYIIANAFWILVIRAAFSNRFAYLSWFILAPVIIYPMLRYRFYRDQNKILAGIFAVYFLFTYYMYYKN